MANSMDISCAKESAASESVWIVCVKRLWEYWLLNWSTFKIHAYKKLELKVFIATKIAPTKKFI